jgi:hypothetical protein
MFRKTIKSILVIFASLALLSLAGCDLLSGITVTAIVSNISDPGTHAVGEIDIMDGGTPITDATVTVNGIPCLGANGVYNFASATPIGDDTTVTLSISVPSKSLNLTKTLTMPNPTTINAPLDLNTYAASSPLTVTWTTVSPNPNQFEILIPLQFTTSGNSYLKILSNTLTTYSVPGGTMKIVPTGVYVNVIPSNTMSIAGSGVKIGSVFTVGNTKTVTIVTN